MSNTETATETNMSGGHHAACVWETFNVNQGLFPARHDLFIYETSV